jgi:hypothetical protein
MTKIRTRLVKEICARKICEYKLRVNRFVEKTYALEICEHKILDQIRRRENVKKAEEYKKEKKCAMQLASTGMRKENGLRYH